MPVRAAPRLKFTGSRKFGTPKFCPPPRAKFPRKYGPASEIWPPRKHSLLYRYNPKIVKLLLNGQDPKSVCQYL
jgi:hypothetical protein